MKLRSRRFLLAAALLGAVGLCARTALTQEAAPAAAAIRPALEGNRGPFEVAFTPDGARVLVTEFDEGALAVIDRASGQVLRHIPTGGTEPTGVAAAPDGKTALVTNSFSGSVAFLDLDTGNAVTLPLRGQPYDVVLSPDGGTAYISVSQLDHVAVIDVSTRQVSRRIPTGRRPRALSLTPDGKVFAVANLTEGSVSFLDTAAGTPIGAGPTPAVNLRGVAVYPNGRLAYCVGQRAQNERPTETAVGVWSNQAFHVVPNGPRNGVENIWLDFIGKDVSDPESVVFDPQRTRAFITCSGGHSVNVLPLRGGGGEARAVLGVGAHPKGLGFSPDGKELWVANHLGNDLAVIDPASLQVVRRVNLGPTTRKDPHLLGRFLFTTATITRGAQFSCNSCHPDGGTDGISWKFVHVQDALGRETNRNVRSLRALNDTLPLRWTGHDKDLATFVQEEVVGLLQTEKLDAEHLRAMVGYLGALPLPPNPHRAPDDAFTEPALRGKALFAGKADCASCHTGPKAGGQRRGWIGTTPQAIDLDVPHLAGVYDTYPYLHDGRATTLDEIFTRHNANRLHGKAHELTAAELQDLLENVRQL